MAPGPIAGAENVVLEGCAALTHEGHDLVLLVMSEQRCPEHGERFLEEARMRGIAARDIRVRGRIDVRALRDLRRSIDRAAPEVVHVHGYKALVYTFLACPNRFPLVVTHHGETGHDRAARLYEGLARRLYRRVSRVFAVSERTADALADAGVPRSKLRTVPNPIALPSEEVPGLTDPDDLRLLFVGRLSEEKGLDVLLQALAAPGIAEGLVLDVAGDGPCRASWTQLAKSLGLDERVRWLGMRRDVPELLGRSSILVLPSRREGLPLAVLEATSRGVPALASRVGGIPEAVWEGENAILLEPGHVDAWISQLLRLPDRIGTLREGARRRAHEVVERHAPATWAARTTACYEELSAVPLEASRTGAIEPPTRSNSTRTERDLFQKGAGRR
ncbi:MAG: glycosyltransferase [Myxococcota bacterium]